MEKKSFEKVLIITTVLGVFLALTVFLSNYFKDSSFYVQKKYLKNRSVAGGFSLKKDSYNEDTARDILFSKTYIEKKEELITFYLGNFLISHPYYNERVFVCDVFSFVELTFVPLELQLSHGNSHMLIQAPCQSKSENLGPFELPYQEISFKPHRKFFALEEKETFIRFHDVSVNMSSKWFLQSVRFFETEEEEDSEFIVSYVSGKEQAYFVLDLSLQQGRSAPLPLRSIKIINGFKKPLSDSKEE